MYVTFISRGINFRARTVSAKSYSHKILFTTLVFPELWDCLSKGVSVTAAVQSTMVIQHVQSNCVFVMLTCERSSPRNYTFIMTKKHNTNNLYFIPIVF